ncbi:hypothetical protein FGO68_gene10787 [Halteria grandinella]|uniref:Uncharacterized protein n=1 Tax=Halteria grandinella TaxID=5974 RepID=A0A8J8NSR2_HALGN|nr:hypothetical protein FGO68_gene10787 [Halteria grandinella]
MEILGLHLIITVFLYDIICSSSSQWTLLKDSLHQLIRIDVAHVFNGLLQSLKVLSTPQFIIFGQCGVFATRIEQGRGISTLIIIAISIKFFLFIIAISNFSRYYNYFRSCCGCCCNWRGSGFKVVPRGVQPP